MTKRLRDLADKFPPPPPPSHFINRADELAWLNAWYTGDSPELLLISGVGGIGKTALAARFSKVIAGQGNNVIWITGANRKLVAQEVGGQDSAEPDRSMFRRMRTSLEGAKDKTLLVLDDENDVDLILAATPRKGLGRLLVTTRDPKLGALGRVLLLGAFKLEDTRKLILAILPSISVHDATRVAERLQGIPLAVELAVRTLERDDGSIGVEQLLARLDGRDVEDSGAATRQTVARRAVKIARADYEEGISLLAQSKYDAAEAYLTRASSALVGLLGPDDQDALAARGALADCYRLSGRPSEAVALMLEVQEGYTRTLGPDHVTTVLSAARLGTALRDVGRVRESIQLFESVVPRLERIVGEDHPDTIRAAAGLAVLHWEVGDQKRALSMQRRVARKATSVFGTDHPDTLTATGNLAFMLSEAGELDAARRYQEQVLDISRRVLGSEHPDTLSAAGNLATLVYQMGDLTAAQELESAVAAGRKRVLGREHPETQLALNNLAITHFAKGDHEQAVDSMKQAVAGYRELSARQPEAFLPDLGRTLTVLATMMVAQGKQNEALVIMDEAVHIYRTLREREGIMSGGALVDGLTRLRDLLEGADQPARMHEVEAELQQIRREQDSRT